MKGLSGRHQGDWETVRGVGHVRGAFEADREFMYSGASMGMVASGGSQGV